MTSPGKLPELLAEYAEVERA
ncbi:MAG: hypothetical protein QOJ34_1232, partial [Pseudonocardiales bacterium]|nr:hypothetical protein [Pseudonocardiales bacterium]